VAGRWAGCTAAGNEDGTEAGHAVANNVVICSGQVAAAAGAGHPWAAARMEHAAVTTMVGQAEVATRNAGWHEK
jgi:hypothetical protein